MLFLLALLKLWNQFIFWCFSIQELPISSNFSWETVDIVEIVVITKHFVGKSKKSNNLYLLVCYKHWTVKHTYADVSNAILFRVIGT